MGGCSPSCFTALTIHHAQKINIGSKSKSGSGQWLILSKKNPNLTLAMTL